LVCPGKKAAYNAAMGRLWALYGAQIGRILEIKALNGGIFRANQKETFCRRIFCEKQPGNLKLEIRSRQNRKYVYPL